MGRLIMVADHLSFAGIDVAVPRGWEAEMGWLDGAPPPADAPGAADASGPVAGFSASTVGPGGQARVHLANFALPPDRGDYGSVAVEMMDAGAIFVSIIEFTAPSTTGTSGVFSLDGLPIEVLGDDFSPDGLQRRLHGQAGLQRFFRVGDRRFVLYVVIGSYRSRFVLAPEATRMLRGITIG